MKIGIDARMFGSKQGGLGRYIEQLILHLETIDTTNEYVVFLRHNNWNDYSPAQPNFKKVLADIHWYGWSEQLFLPQIIYKEDIDLMHFPHWNVPLLYNKKFVVTIHDLLLIHHPSRKNSTLGPIKYFIKNTLFRLALNHAAKKSQKIITVSEFSKQDIAKTLKIPVQKIEVSLLAPMPKTTIYNPPFSLNNKYKITKPYWLYVGVAYPHKNLPFLIKAWKIFHLENSDYQLVLVGHKNFFYNQLATQIKKQQIADVIFTDYVPDLELPELYQNASLYIFPSLYEGFGLPPLEAMQFELPVISSNTTCLPEILGDAALYFNPHDIKDFISKAKQAMTDKNIRTNLVENGRKILQKYSWKTTAEQTLQIYLSTTKKSG